MKRRTGTYRVIKFHDEQVRAFIPYPLPPAKPKLALDDTIAQAHADALNSLARLTVAGTMVPSTNWFLYGFVRKEAVITSRIEGTQATLRDVFTYEVTEEAEHPEDVEQVCNYVEALAYARNQLAKPRGLPLSARLLCESHRILMRGVRGTDKQPGEMRRTQNWIGGTRPGNARYTPPPPEDVPEAMATLERWLHSEDPLPPLVKTGLAHVQFETIHPFLDGNGRIGRLLIALLVEHWGLLTQPLLYLSVAFRHRQREYYDRLAAVRTEGDWEGWTVFFLDCVREVADDGVQVARALHMQLGEDRERLVNHSRATVAAVRLFDQLPRHPVITVPKAAEAIGLTQPPTRKAIELLTNLGVLRETTGRERHKVFAYHKYLRILTGEDA